MQASLSVREVLLFQFCQPSTDETEYLIMVYLKGGEEDCSNSGVRPLRMTNTILISRMNSGDHSENT